MQKILVAADTDDAQTEAKDLVQSSHPLQADQICLLIGATPEDEKQRIRQELQEGKIKLVIGTHALIQDPVTFADLQMVVVDEQHRFGVEQRAALRVKGDNAHLLVMTATPIPRTLALSIYGDLDLSIIDELPAGRQPVSTHILPPRNRERAYSLFRSNLEQGRQAFIIYPLVEESENSETKAATEEHNRLQQEIFPNYKIGLLHGRLKPEEKEEVMSEFKSGECNILVSTSVIEVGVDIPNATVMLIEGANRFGLAQLHQFRGRVGRGSEQSYCILIPDTADDLDNERLAVLSQTNDGFLLAEKDLEQRGPGQFLGTRQSGYSEFQLANLTKIEVIEKAQRLAQELLNIDPELSRPDHLLLAQAVKTSWNPFQADVS
jgi:ATP-dependent DNA helicase RecG